MVPAGTFFAEGQGVVETATQDNEAYSLFGQVDYDLTDRVVLTLGVNYTNDEKDVTLSQVNTDVFSQLDLAPLGLDALAGLQFLPQLLAFPNAGESGSSSDDNVDYTARISFDVTNELNAYVSYATGFKATSWNLSRDSRPTVGELCTAAGERHAAAEQSRHRYPPGGPGRGRGLRDRPEGTTGLRDVQRRALRADAG